MSVSFLKTIPDGSKIYFRPVGATGPAHVDEHCSITSGQTGLRYTGCIVSYRIGREPESSSCIAATTLKSGLVEAPVAVREQIELHISKIEQAPMPVVISNTKKLHFSKPIVMGVLNVTPDSFSDGGDYADTMVAIKRGRQMIAEGADIIDIGGESTRPGATPVWEGDEAERIVPVIEGLRDEGVLISVDTRHASVMQKAFDAGAHIINDVSALTFDQSSIDVAKRTEAPVILMHAQGDPQTMQDNPDYANVLFDVYDYLAERIDACVAAGIERAHIIVDPGIGFGKRVVKDNVSLLNGLTLFQTLGCPLLVGASRKRFIGAITDVDTASDRQIGSVVAAVKACENGANIIRVHDVAETVEALKLTQAFRDGESMDGIA